MFRLIQDFKDAGLGWGEYLTLTGITIYVGFCTILLASWAIEEEPTVTEGQVPALSAPDERPGACLKLVRGENGEPDYVLAMGEECQE